LIIAVHEVFFRLSPKEHNEQRVRGYCFRPFPFCVCSPLSPATPAPQPDRERAWFRKQFAIDRRCESAKLFICGDDGLNVFIDGREVLSSESWTTPT